MGTQTTDMAAAARRAPAERPVPAAKVERAIQRLRTNIGRNLLRIRSEQQMSQRALAEKANISQTYISQIETLKAKHSLGIELIAALAVALDVSPTDLVAD
jgi:ribosome-binding protein aMBF1 (putative translation factor)